MGPCVANDSDFASISSDAIGAASSETTVNIGADLVRDYNAIVIGTDTPGRRLDSAGHVVAHPAFLLAAEWQLLLAAPLPLDRWATRNGIVRVLHVSHSSVLKDTLVGPDTLRLRWHIDDLRSHRFGVLQYLRIVTRRAGRTVAESRMESLYLDLKLVDGRAATVSSSRRSERASGEELPLGEASVTHLTYDLGFVGRYARAAGIYHPVHEDNDVALTFGLPAAIMHGSASLALAMSNCGVERADLLGNTMGFGGRFTSPAVIPGELRIRSFRRPTDGRRIVFDVHEGASAVIKDGYLDLAPSHGLSSGC
jgi:acyl dehydratase